MKPSPHDRSMAAFERWRPIFKSKTDIARHFGLQTATICQWEARGLPRGWAALGAELHKLPYNPSDYNLPTTNGTV